MVSLKDILAACSSSTGEDVRTPEPTVTGSQVPTSEDAQSQVPTRLDTADEPLVDLDHAAQLVSLRPDRRTAELVEL